MGGAGLPPSPAQISISTILCASAATASQKDSGRQSMTIWDLGLWPILIHFCCVFFCLVVLFMWFGNNRITGLAFGRGGGPGLRFTEDLTD